MARTARLRLRSALAETLLARERLGGGVAYNPFAARLARNPYPLYADMRARDPVHRSRLLNAWMLTRYADVDAVLRDHRNFSNDPRNGNLSRRQRATLPPPGEFTMLFLDPPDHRRLRTLVNKAFTLKAVNALEPGIRGTTRTLLDGIGDSGAFDFMRAVAGPLPVTVIARMLGVPPEDHPRFRVWSAQRARLLEPLIEVRERRVAERASAEFDGYFRGIIAQRRAEPRDDIISALAHVEEEGERLSEREMLNMLRLLLVAGNETTTNLIGNGLLALLRNPDQMARLRDEPALIPSAVDELLRYDSPIQMDVRHALADREIGGVRIERRQTVLLLLGAANRDPEAFGDPDRLDVGRNGESHLSFGRGIHHCLGAPLARLETRIVLEETLERFPGIALGADDPEFRPGVLLRGLRALPLVRAGR